MMEPTNIIIQISDTYSDDIFKMILNLVPKNTTIEVVEKIDTLFFNMRYTLHKEYKFVKI